MCYTVCVEQAVLRTSSFLLNDDQSESWMDLPQATQSETATRLLSTVEDSAFQVARTCNEPKTIINITLNIGSPHFSLLTITSKVVEGIWHMVEGMLEAVAIFSRLVS